MHLSIAAVATALLAIAGSVDSSAIPRGLNKRATINIGWHAMKTEKVEKMKEAGTLLQLGNTSPGNNQLGDGVYLSEKYNDWAGTGKTVCLFAADLTKFTSTNKVKYPLKNRQNKNIQWQFSYPEKVPAGKFSKAFFTEMKMNPEDTIRLSKWDRGIQMMIPDSKVGTANPLGITIVECAPYEEMEKLENKGVVINMKAFPGLHKGWFEGETPPPLEEEACELVKRDGKGKGKNGKKGSKSCKKKGKKTKKTKKAKKTKKTKKAKKTKKTKHTKTKKAKKHTRRPKKTAGRGGRRGGRRN